MTDEGHELRVRRMGIDTYAEPVAYMRSDCHVCLSEGFEALSRVAVEVDGKRILATLNVVQTDLLLPGWIGLSETAWGELGRPERGTARVRHAEPVGSFSIVRGKLHGQRFDEAGLRRVIGDISARRFTDVQISAFIATCAERLDLDEVIALTRAMIDSGERLEWGRGVVVDKHCVGGLPGNRTTPIVVAIAAAAGLTMPKTSSRAITSPAGTADAMEQLAPVDLDLVAMKRVVSSTGGCITWGGSVQLSPADDILIRVERALDIDTEGQLVASVLSKKAAAGSTHVLIDIPTGPTAKVRSEGAARRLAQLLEAVGAAVGLEVAVVITDGSAPIGRGIGPSLEARDVLAVLQRRPEAPVDLRERATFLAGELLQLAGAVAQGAGQGVARRLLESGAAWATFAEICHAQGGRRTPGVASRVVPVIAPRSGVVARFDNRVLARAAKLAGAPTSPNAGIDLQVTVGQRVDEGAPLFALHADSDGELRYALDYIEAHPELIQISTEETP